MKKSLEDKLKSQYEKMFEIPPENIWERIEQDLGNQHPRIFKINFSYYKCIAASVILLLSFRFLFNHFSENKPENKIFVKNNIPQEIKPKSTVEVIDKQKDMILNIENQIVRNEVATPIIQTEIREQKNATQPENQLEIQPAKNPKDTFQVAENQPVIIAKEVKTEPKKYITADELLFSREVEKTLNEQQKSDGFKIGLKVPNLKKPEKIEIMGINIYSDKKR